MTHPIFHEIMHLDDDTEVTVKFTQGPYYPAVISGPADNWSPGEGGEIEIVDVLSEDGITVEVSDATRERFYDELYRMPPHEYEPDPDMLVEQRRDDREMQRDDWRDGDGW